MTLSLRPLALAAAAAAGLAAQDARAHDDRHQPLPWPPVVGRPALVVQAQLPPSPAPYPPSPGVYAPAPPPARHAFPVPSPWPGRSAIHELTHEYRRLDMLRDRFYRRWGWNPWRVSRFEAWYGQRRAELDQRWAELQQWHERRERWPDHGGWRHDDD